jgi:hypothetical protein
MMAAVPTAMTAELLLLPPELLLLPDPDTSGFSEHCVPDPVKPVLQLQLNDPNVLTHDALTEQVCKGAVHSSTSAHCVPGPANPLLQLQTKDDAVSTHCECTLHVWVRSAHSFPLQNTPEPM